MVVLLRSMWMRLISARISTRSLASRLLEWLVEQEALGIAHDGAADRNALALSAREGLRLAIEHLFDAQNLGGLFDLLADDVFRNFAELEPERHVLEHGHVRVERVVLEHHRDVAIFGRHVVDEALADVNRARR